MKVDRARFVERLSLNRIADRFKVGKATVVRHFDHAEAPVDTGLPDGPPPPGLPTGLALVAPPPPPSASDQCAVCRCEQVADINRALAMSQPIAQLERTYPVSAESLVHHRDECLAEYLERAKVKLTAGTVLEQIDGLRAEVHEFLQMARTADDKRLWGMAIQRAERSIALLAKVTTDLEGDEEAFLRSRFWTALCDAHSRALAPFPEAAAALRAELEQVFS